MYNWLNFHYFYLYGCIFLIIIINCIYVSMNKKAKAIKMTTKVEDDKL